MKRSRLFSLALVSAVVIATQSLPAMAATITFDALPASRNPGTFVTGGFSFSGVDFVSFGSSFCGPQCPENNTNYLLDQDIWTAGWSMSKSDGGSFSLLSFDGAEAHLGLPSIWAENILVTGTLSGGGTVSATFALDFLQDGGGAGNDFQRFSLSSDFSDLVSVRFLGAGSGANWFSVDNIEVGSADSNAVPEPASLALLGLGLAGLGAMRRKQKTA